VLLVRTANSDTDGSRPGLSVVTGEIVEEGTYGILPIKGKNLTIDVPGSSKENGKGLAAKTVTYIDSQWFTVKKVGNYQYTITALHSGLNWTSPGNVGGSITQNTANDSSSQIFTITRSSYSAFTIRDSKGLYIGFSDGKVKNNAGLILRTDAYEDRQEFTFAKLEKVTPTPTPVLTEPSLIPEDMEPISGSIPAGWYNFVCNNMYISDNSVEAILTKNKYFNLLYLEPLGNNTYAIRTAYNAYWTTIDSKPRNGDKVLVKTPPVDDDIDRSFIYSKWIIEPDKSGTNVFTIRPANNRNLILSAEYGSLKLVTKPSKAENTRITIFKEAR
jgi:hypothetical protein